MKLFAVRCTPLIIRADHRVCDPPPPPALCARATFDDLCTSLKITVRTVFVEEEICIFLRELEREIHTRESWTMARYIEY